MKTIAYTIESVKNEKHVEKHDYGYSDVQQLQTQKLGQIRQLFDL